jgi:hypothetical protein
MNPSFQIGTVHMRPIWSIAIAAILLLWTLWYWLRLGGPEVPPSCRKIRRFSMAIMLLSLPVFVTALSFVDPDAEQIRYVRTWMAAFGMLTLVIASALIDAWNNLRLHARFRQQAVRGTANSLAREIKKRRGEKGPHP